MPVQVTWNLSDSDSNEALQRLPWENGDARSSYQPYQPYDPDRPDQSGQPDQSASMSLRGEAEAQLANGLNKAMEKARCVPRDIEEAAEGDNEHDANDRTRLRHLSQVGALPPTAEEADDEREIDVMSEPPEIDTTRADKPPMFRNGVRTCIRRTVLLVVFAALVVSIVMIVLFSVGMWETDCDVDQIYDAKLMLRTNTSKAMATHACLAAKEFVKGTLGDSDHP
jgi:hypothetical protein